MHKVLVLGGEGMLGHMVVQVLARSERIDVEHTSRSNKSGCFFDVQDGLGPLKQIFEQKGSFDWIINCIGVLSNSIDEANSDSTPRAILVNALFPHNLGQLARRFGARIIQISTDGVFSGRSAAAYLEDAPHDCVDIYGKTKSLGEVRQQGFLNIRCSIIGSDPEEKRGLLEWFLAQPDGKPVQGYTDHMWNGVTTLQFADLCSKIIVEDCFEAIWEDSPVHHFCPNRPVSKFELLNIFKSVYERDLSITPSTGASPPARRILDTKYQTIKKLFGHNLDMEDAVQGLANWRENVN